MLAGMESLTGMNQSVARKVADAKLGALMTANDLPALRIVIEKLEGVASRKKLEAAAKIRDRLIETAERQAAQTHVHTVDNLP